MLPLREDKLPSHVSTLRWIGVPFILLLTVNFGCVLYAVSRPTVEESVAALPTVDAHVIKNRPTHSESHSGLDHVRQDITQALAHGGKASNIEALGTNASRAVWDAKHENLLAAEERESRRNRWVTSWLHRQSDWNRQRNDRTEATDRETHTTSRRVFRAPARPASLPGGSPHTRLVLRPPAERTATGRPETTVETASPPASFAAEPEYEPERLVIYNPKASPGMVVFLVDGVQYGLQPGDRETFSGGKRRTIMFHRGGDFGNATEQRGPGVFEFSVSASTGWELLPTQ